MEKSTTLAPSCKMSNAKSAMAQGGAIRKAKRSLCGLTKENAEYVMHRIKAQNSTLPHTFKELSAPL
jgi:hypothetical protein